MNKKAPIIGFFDKVRLNQYQLEYSQKEAGKPIRVPSLNFIRIYIGFFIVCFGLDQLAKLWNLGWSDRLVTNLGFALVFSWTAYPLFVWILRCIKAKDFLTGVFLQFPTGAQYWYSTILFWLITLPINIAFPSLLRGNAMIHPLISYIGGGVVLRFFMKWWDKNMILVSGKRVLPGADGSFGLYLGASTGFLGSLSHGAGLKGGQNVVLSLEDSAQNILVLGGIGSGKTTRAIQPFLVQLLNQDAGGLIFDVKGDFKNAVNTIAVEVGREVTVIGPDRTKMNLLTGLTPEIASSFLKSAILMNSGSPKDKFWIDSAEALCKNALGVLSFFPGRYNLSELYTYLFDNGVRDGINEEATAKLPTLSDREGRLLKTYLSYYEQIFSSFDDKVRSGVNASVAQVLAPFNHPDLVDAFCTDDKNAPTMNEVLDGTVYLVDMPLARWGLGGKVAYNFIKLRFFNTMQRRNVEGAWNKERPVFFMCDEFQEIVSANRDGLSDLNFWDKSRSSKCIGIVSAQAVSSFYAAIGDRDLADALIQNFRQKLCFRTEDSHTIEMLNHLLGRVEIERVSVNEGKSQSSGGLFSGQFSQSDNTSVSRSVIERQVINPQLFRTMGQNQAIALLSFAGSSADDVIECAPIFV